MNRFSSHFLFLATVVSVLPAHADVVPMNKTQLQHALKAEAPCCVIDGRDASNRKKKPLSDALPYTPGMQINPTAAVVIVADNDRLAGKIAGEFDAAYPGKRIIAVQGGIGVWEAALVAASREAASTPGFSFVIPKNTCESGTAIQQLRSGFPKH
jgi:hypothetical protein